MEDPAAIQCNLDGNPLHEEQLEIMGMLGDVYAVNTVIDEARRLCFVNFGEIVESHLEAVRFVRDACAVPVSRRFRTVVTSAAGYPLDRTYYQTVKGMVTPIDSLRRCALIIAPPVRRDWAQYREARGAGSSPKVRGFSRHMTRDRRHREWQTEMQLQAECVRGVSTCTSGASREDRALLPACTSSIVEAPCMVGAVDGRSGVAVIRGGTTWCAIRGPAA